VNRYKDSVSALFVAVLIAMGYSCATPATAEHAAVSKEFSKEKLDELLAAIAFYPDDLLTNILIGPRV
jgi:hypothetical protein